jgi:hypothetical protein
MEFMRSISPVGTLLELVVSALRDAVMSKRWSEKIRLPPGDS